MMGAQTELMGRELARQIHMLALDVRTGQNSLYPNEKPVEGR